MKTTIILIHQMNMLFESYVMNMAIDKRMVKPSTFHVTATKKVVLPDTLATPILTQCYVTSRTTNCSAVKLNSTLTTMRSFKLVRSKRVDTISRTISIPNLKYTLTQTAMFSSIATHAQRQDMDTSIIKYTLHKLLLPRLIIMLSDHTLVSRLLNVLRKHLPRRHNGQRPLHTYPCVVMSKLETHVLTSNVLMSPYPLTPSFPVIVISLAQPAAKSFLECPPRFSTYMVCVTKASSPKLTLILFDMKERHGSYDATTPRKKTAKK